VQAAIGHLLTDPATYVGANLVWGGVKKTIAKEGLAAGLKLIAKNMIIPMASEGAIEATHELGLETMQVIGKNQSEVNKANIAVSFVAGAALSGVMGGVMTEIMKTGKMGAPELGKIKKGLSGMTPEKKKVLAPKVDNLIEAVKTEASAKVKEAIPKSGKNILGVTKKTKIATKKGNIIFDPNVVDASPKTTTSTKSTITPREGYIEFDADKIDTGSYTPKDGVNADASTTYHGDANEKPQSVSEALDDYVETAKELGELTVDMPTEKVPHGKLPLEETIDTAGKKQVIFGERQRKASMAQNPFNVKSVQRIETATGLKKPAPLPEQKHNTALGNMKKFVDYAPEFRGRMIATTDTMVTPQLGLDAKAKLQVDKINIKTQDDIPKFTKEYVDNVMVRAEIENTFNRGETLYRSDADAKMKKGANVIHRSPEEMTALKRQATIDSLDLLRHDMSLPLNVRKRATEMMYDFKANAAEVRRFKLSNADKERAMKAYDQETKDILVPHALVEDTTMRLAEIVAGEKSAATKAGKSFDYTQKKFFKDKTPEQLAEGRTRMESYITKEADALYGAAQDAYRHIEGKEASAGNKWDGDMTPEILTKYGRKGADLQKFQELTAIQKAGTRVTDEQLYTYLQYNHLPYLQRELQVKSKDIQATEAIERGNDIRDMQEILGVGEKNKLQSVKKPDAKEGPESEESWLRRQASREQLRKVKLKQFDNPDWKKKHEMGFALGGEVRALLKEADVNGVPILSKQEILDGLVPAEQQNAHIKSVEKAAKEAMYKMRYQRIADKIGWKHQPGDFLHKYDNHAWVVDASNSGYQQEAIMMLDPVLAHYTKMYGPDGADIRTHIGESIGKLFTDNIDRINATSTEVDANTRVALKALFTNPSDGKVFKNQDAFLQSLQKPMGLPHKPTWKDVVKKLFMTMGYGITDDGARRDMIRDLGFTMDQADGFMHLVEKEIRELVPSIKVFETEVFNLMSNGNMQAIGKWTRPDGFEMEIDFRQVQDFGYINLGMNTARGEKAGNISLRGKTDQVDIHRRSLIAHIIHNVDSYGIYKLQKDGVHTIHDAMFVPKGKTDQDIATSYLKTMKDLAEEDLLHDIMTQLGYEGEPLRGRFNLDKDGNAEVFNIDRIMESRNALSTEVMTSDMQVDTNGNPFPRLIGAEKLREPETGRYMTKTDTVIDMLAQTDHRLIASDRLVNQIIEESIHDSERRLKYPNDSIFEAMVAHAWQSNKMPDDFARYNKNGMDPQAFKAASVAIFRKARTLLEIHPISRDKLFGDRVFAPEGELVDLKSRKEYLQMHREWRQQEWVKMNDAEKLEYKNDFDTYNNYELSYLQAEIDGKNDMLASKYYDPSLPPKHAAPFSLKKGEKMEFNLDLGAAKKQPTNNYYEGNITPDKDTVFVFGSNPEGRHGAGAAKVAKNQFGAKYGQGEGLQGSAYALPTKDLRVKANRGLRSITPEQITKSIESLYETARQNPEKQFKIGFRNTDQATLNGYTGYEMIDMFHNAGDAPSNIVPSKEWADIGFHKKPVETEPKNVLQQKAKPINKKISFNKTTETTTTTVRPNEDILVIPVKVQKEMDSVKARLRYAAKMQRDVRKMQSVDANGEALGKKAVLDESGEVVDIVDTLREDGLTTPAWNQIFSKYSREIERQRNETTWAKQFNELAGMSKWATKDTARRKSALLNHLIKEIPEELDEAITHNLLYTDYQILHRHGVDTPQRAAAFMGRYRHIYDDLKYYIDSMAMGLRSNEYKVGGWKNNPVQLLNHLGKPIEDAGIVDVLVSIRAMDDAKWKFVDRNKASTWFDEIMNIAMAKEADRKLLFDDSGAEYIKGWWSNIGTNGREIGPDGTRRWATNADKREQGVMPIDIERAKIGKNAMQTEADRVRWDDPLYRQSMTFKKDSPSDLKQAYKQSLKVDAQNRRVRRVAAERIRAAVGKSYKATEIIAASVHQTKEKLSRRSFVKQVKDGDFSEIFSSSPKEGMRHIKLEDRAVVDYMLGEDVKYIDARAYDMIIGRDSVTTSGLLWKKSDAFYQRFNDHFNSQFGGKLSNEEIVTKMKNGSKLWSLEDPKINGKFKRVPPLMMEQLPKDIQKYAKIVPTDMYHALIGSNKIIVPEPTNKKFGLTKHQFEVTEQGYYDLVTRFKQGVILKNLPSFINNAAVGITTAMIGGIGPIKMAKYISQSHKSIKFIANRTREIAVLEAQGKDFSHILKRLEMDPLYKLEKAGLSTNAVDGLRQDRPLLNNMISNIVNDNKKVTGFFNNVLLNEGTKAGDFLSSTFSEIDTTSRFMVAMDEIEMAQKRAKKQGIPFDEKQAYADAVVVANNLYADMDIIAHPVIEFVDKHGQIKFAKWFSRSAPGLSLYITKNPKNFARFAALFVATLAIEDMVNDEIEKKGWSVKGQFVDGGFDITGKSSATALFEYIHGATKKDWYNPVKYGAGNVINGHTSPAESMARWGLPYLIPGQFSKFLNRYNDFIPDEKGNTKMTPAKFMKLMLVSNAGAAYNLEADPEKKFRLDTRGFFDYWGDTTGAFPTSFDRNKYSKKRKK